MAFNSSKKPFCKVCCDSGKLEAEYSNHWIKNEKGKVICPTLLVLVCKYCFKKGHTVSYCAILNKNKKREAFFEKNKSVDIKINKKNNKIGNRFEALDSDEEEEEEILVRPDSPLSPPPSSFKPSYASILCKEKEIPVLAAVGVGDVDCVAPGYNLPKIVLPPKRKLWSDYTSDDDVDLEDD